MFRRSENASTAGRRPPPGVTSRSNPFSLARRTIRFAVGFGMPAEATKSGVLERRASAAFQRSASNPSLAPLPFAGAVVSLGIGSAARWCFVAILLGLLIYQRPCAAYRLVVEQRARPD